MPPATWCRSIRLSRVWSVTGTEKSLGGQQHISQETHSRPPHGIVWTAVCGRVNNAQYGVVSIQRVKRKIEPKFKIYI